MKKRNFLLACGFSLIFGLSAAQAAETLKVGATPVPHADILNVVQPMLAKQGVDLKIVEFSPCFSRYPGNLIGSQNSV